jgi:hypothetical protein
MPDRYAYLKMVNDVDNAMPWDTKLIAAHAGLEQDRKFNKLLTVKLELQPMINLS